MRTYIIYEDAKDEVHRGVLPGCMSYIEEVYGNTVESIQLQILLPTSISLADLTPGERNTLMKKLTFKQRMTFTKYLITKYKRGD